MSFLKGKGAAIGIVVCFMAVLAVVGTYTVGNYKKDMKEQMKMNKKAGKMCLIQQGRKKEFSRREAPRQIFGFQKKAFLHGLQAEQ